MFFRGLASSLQAAAFNFEGLMACRWFLATAEAGFTPGVPYLLSFFYRRHEIGFRCGIFVSMAPLATTFAGGLLSVVEQIRVRERRMLTGHLGQVL